MSEIVNITAAEFEEKVTKAEGLILVDFWAAWCGPCKAMLPSLEDLNKTNEKVKILKVDVDDNSELTSKFGIRSIPTLIFFKGGSEVKRLVGMTAKNVLEKTIEELA